MDRDVEHELCANCKKEIPQPNYVMHTAHCARNITLCKTCNEPIPKGQYEDHKKTCEKPKPVVRLPAPSSVLENSSYYQSRKAVEDQKASLRKERYLQKHDRFVDTGYSLKSSHPPPLPMREEIPLTKPSVNKPPVQNGALPRLVNPPPKTSGLLACKFCDLELPKLDLEDHENYCGSRTDKCLECGELVMFKDKQSHLDSNQCLGRRRNGGGWDSQTQRSSASSSSLDVGYTPRRRPSPLADFDYDPLPYMPNAFMPGRQGAPPGIKIEKGESYKEISRRLDCPAPQPPRRRNPPTELSIPCEFCGIPFPHEDLVDHENICRLARKSHITIPCSYCRTPILQEDIYLHETCCGENQMSSRQPTQQQVTMPCEFCQSQIPEDDLIRHETGCRPDLARRGAPRRRKSPEPDDYFVAPQPQPSSPEIELPCEFCADMIPASQLLRHQAGCS